MPEPPLRIRRKLYHFKALGIKAVHLSSLFAPSFAPFDSPDLLLSVLEFQPFSFPNRNIRAPEENVWTAAGYLK